MTIAAGFVCKDGIVICADSQVSWNGYKWPTDKIAASHLSDSPVAIVGAGFTHAIEVASQKILDRLWRGFDSEEFAVGRIEEILREINEKDLAYHPTDNPSDLSFQLLIAFRTSSGHFSLHETDGSLVKRVNEFAVIGSGLVINTFAHSLYRKNYIFRQMPIMRTSEVQIMAAYLVYLAKRQLDSVGGPTKVALLGAEGGIRYMEDWDNPEFSDMFGWHEKNSLRLMFNCCDPDISDDKFGAMMDAFGEAMKEKKKAFSASSTAWRERWEVLCTVDANSSDLQKSED